MLHCNECISAYFCWAHNILSRCTLLLCCVARMESISIFVAPRDAARHGGAVRHIVNLALLSLFQLSVPLSLARCLPSSLFFLTLFPLLLPFLINSLPPSLSLTPSFPSFPLQLITDTASSGGSPGFLVSVFQKLYGSQAHLTIVRYNDFSDIAAYFVQKVSVYTM